MASDESRGPAVTLEPEIFVYHKPGCPFAARLRVGLTLARVPHCSKRFRDDEEAAALVRQANGGNEVSPTVLVGGTYLANPSVRAVRAALRGPLT
jgi:mycoredoxin